jgi:hypothetical protein
MRVFVAPCEDHARAWTNQRDSLVKLAGVAEPQRHTLVDAPGDADVIIITDLRDEDRFASLRAHPLVHRYPQQTFVYSDTDHPIAFVHGIYVSMPRSKVNLGRVEGGMYVTEISEWNNPFVTDAPRAERDLLFSFVGRDSAPVRSRLLAHDFGRADVLVEDTSASYLHWDHTTPERDAFQRRYVETCARSRFVVCPRGAGTSSIRLFEIMQMGIAPVILSDQWIRPPGPRWEEFAVFVKERDVESLDRIVSAHDHRWEEMGRRAAEHWHRWFRPENQFNYIVDRIESIQRRQKLNEATAHRLWRPAMVGRRGRSLVRRIYSRLRP